MKIAILTCMWKRYEMDIVFMSYFNKILDKISKERKVEFVKITVISEEETKKNVIAYNWLYVEHSNNPLGAKWNRGLQELKKHKIDAVLILGSDDFICEQTIHLYIDHLNQGKKYLGIKDFYLYNQINRKCLYWSGYYNERKDESIGLGRCIHVDIIKACQWILWEDSLNQTLDLSMIQRIKDKYDPIKLDQESVVFSCIEHDLIAIDIKTNQNIWGFSKFENFNHPDVKSNSYYVNYEDIVLKLIDEKIFDRIDKFNHDASLLLPREYRNIENLKENCKKINISHDVLLCYDYIERYLSVYPHDPEALMIKANLFNFNHEKNYAEQNYIKAYFFSELNKTNDLTIEILYNLILLYLSMNNIDQVLLLLNHFISIDVVDQEKRELMLNEIYAEIEKSTLIIEHIHHKLRK